MIDLLSYTAMYLHAAWPVAGCRSSSQPLGVCVTSSSVNVKSGMMTRSFAMTESQLHLGEHIGSAGLNDRADLFDWLLAAAQLLNATACFAGSPGSVLAPEHSPVIARSWDTYFRSGPGGQPFARCELPPTPCVRLSKWENGLRQRCRLKRDPNATRHLEAPPLVCSLLLLLMV